MYVKREHIGVTRVENVETYIKQTNNRDKEKDRERETDWHIHTHTQIVKMKRVLHKPCLREPAQGLVNVLQLQAYEP